MGRGVLGVMLLVAASLVDSGSAAAATTTTHVRFHGLQATAEWAQASDSSFVDTFVDVSHTNKGDELFIDVSQSTATGVTDYTVDSTSGFSAFIQSRTFNSASVSGSGLRARKCVYDESGNKTCTHTRISIDAQWRGSGPLISEKSHDSFSVKGFRDTFSSNGRFHNATATATVAGISLGPQDQDFAQIGVFKSFDFTMCRGKGC